MRSGVQKRNKIMSDYPNINYMIYEDEDMSNTANRWTNTITMNKIDYRECSDDALFSLLHEIGHIKTDRRRMPVSMSEYKATVWAIAHMKKYKINVTERFKKRFQRYIWSYIDDDKLYLSFGTIDGPVPSKKDLTLDWGE